MVDAEDKDHNINERIYHTKKETRWKKRASNIIIKEEKKMTHDIIQDTQFMMK